MPSLHFQGPDGGTQQVHKDASILVQVLQNSSDVGYPRATRKGPEGRALTPGAVAMGIHEGEAQPLILLQGALVREAPVHGAHHVCLLLAVVDSCLGHVHRLPVEEGEQDMWVLSWERQCPEVDGEAQKSRALRPEPF